MNVSFEPPNCGHEDEMNEIVREVVERHPLRSKVLAHEDLESLHLKLILVDEDSRLDPEIDCAQFPRVVLRFGRDRYVSPDSSFDQALFRTHMCHEFTHLIDRQNPAFGITQEKEDHCRGLSKGVVPDICVDIWNLYINGRLWRSGIQVESFEQFRHKRFGRRIDLGQPCTNKSALHRRAWQCDVLAYDDIIDLAQAIRDCGWD